MQTLQQESKISFESVVQIKKKCYLIYGLRLIKLVAGNLVFKFKYVNELKAKNLQLNVSALDCQLIVLVTFD